jgi:hypothetical protein
MIHQSEEQSDGWIQEIRGIPLSLDLAALSKREHSTTFLLRNR